MLRIFSFRMFFGIFVTLVALEIQISIAIAQFDSESSYEVMVEVAAVNNNFFQARKKAFKMALKSSLKQDLLEILGDEEFERNQVEIKKMLRKPKKYVKSYRFLEAYDDPIKMVSQVKLQVVLSQDAVNNYLKQTGVATGLEVGKQVVIIINEIGLNSTNDLGFWETKSIPETLLVRNFIEEGIPVVRRGFIRYAISEETITNAMSGDLSAAINIGMKVGADIVIVGNATSTLVTNDQIQSPQPVRVAISIKAVSSQSSTLIAAKSDFATATRNEVLESEFEAYNRVGQKLTEFLIPVIQNHWEVGNEKKQVKRSEPTSKNNSSPLPWSDL